ncbi:hypothetical protein QTP70_014844 [Hemibagrus guttatus]|uniref:Reverse transcriptase domain-containing protein n=1 Tax=Hemibagrus guttatus TaxID=175788 RepID=A0AAE0PQJ7_9TELE|nr:hypothetical protein QTP70_014844 [Hemibagrus guttatus]
MHTTARLSYENPSRPALPSIILSNVCSLDNKLDYIQLQRTTQCEYRDCCVFVFTKTWLSNRVPEAAIQLDGLTVFPADRNAALCSKTRSGGVCVYINTEWCKNSVLVSSYSSSLVEFVTVRCRPFYVTCYIGKCINDVTLSKTITTRSNQKLWMTAEVSALLKLRDSASAWGEEDLKNSKGQTLRAIKEAKRTHARRFHGHFQYSRDSRCMWQGIQVITNYKTTASACDNDASLPDALNDFYVWFKAHNHVAAWKTIPPPNDQVLCHSTADVKRTLCRVNPRNSAGPDNIPGRVLRECAEQLADVFTDIFNISLSSTVVPTCLKTTTIVPVPKKSRVSCLNDYHPVATQLLPSLDPLQFAYRPNRFTDNAITITLHLSITHLDNKETYVRMLFIDFSSAFNTIIPQHLIEKLSLLGLNTSLCNWILDFLTGRPQSVRIGNSFSSTTTLSTGAPEGCVLSPLLFTLLTHDCAAMHSSNHITKFDDDMTVVGLISKTDKSAYREEVQYLTAWCKANSLSLNVDKTKEMVVDFRRAQSDHSPLFIDGSPVEIVNSTKFLGVHLAENFTWALNTTSISKKAQQHLYFLRRLRKAHLPPPILTMFYRGTIESILSSCITAWFGNCTVSDLQDPAVDSEES